MNHLAQQAVELVVLALAVSALSLTITKAKISEPVRDWIADRNTWFGDLVSCPYCTSHWLAFGAVAAFKPTLVSSGFLFLDLFVSAFVIVALRDALGSDVQGHEGNPLNFRRHQGALRHHTK